MAPSEVANELMMMAAGRSVQTQFGWSHPDCEVLMEAARLIRCEPEKIDVPPEAVACWAMGWRGP
jgi:hypothetical protein